MSEESRAKKISKTPQVLVMGVGSSGTHAVAHMAGLNPEMNAVAVDTDTEVLKACGVRRVIQIGSAVTNGFSAGGDVELGRQSVEKDSSNIRALLRKADLVIIVAGLGGGTGSGAAPVIARIAREADTLVMCLLTTPFNLEGKSVAVKAQDAVKKLRTHADAIVKIPNESLIGRSEKEVTAEDAFGRGQRVIAEGVLSLWGMLSQPGICGLDFACIHTMLRNCDGFCHFARAEADGDNREGDVLKAILTHRLLNGGKVLPNAAGLIVGLTGGTDLKLSEIQNVVSGVQEKVAEDEVWFNFGVATDPDYEGRLAVLVLVAEQWKEPLMADDRRQLGFSFSTRSGEQGLLPLETTGKGRFTNLDPTILDNQDLDVPAYIRRNIKLPR